MSGATSSGHHRVDDAELASQDADQQREGCFLGYHSLDSAGRLLDVNRAWLDLLGYSREEVIGRPFADFLAPQHREQFQKRFLRLKELGRTHALEFELLSKGGDVFVLSIDACMERAEGELLPRAHCVAYDITDQKHAQEALQRSRTELRTIYDCAPVMMCVLDASGQVLNANRALAEFTGRSEASLINQGLGEVLGCVAALSSPGGCQSGNACEICPLRIAMADTFQTGRPHRGVERWMTLNLDGVKRNVALLGSTAVIPTGGEPNLLLCLEDITRRKRAEELRLAGEEKYRRIVEMVNEGFWIVDASGRCTYANQNFADMLGCRADEVVGRRISDFTFEEDLPQHLALMAEWSTGEHKRVVVRLRRKDGSECWMVVSGSMERDAEGRSVGGQGMAIDVTRQKADERRCELMESQLRHASRLATLGELAAGIAHEINQPLCSIVNFAKACKNVASQPQPNLQHLREWSEAIATAAARSGDIVRRLCGFARHSQDRPVAVSIQELVNDATMLMRFDLQSRKITLRPEMPDQPLTVLVYPVQVHQVLVNLLRNAIEAVDRDDDKGQLAIRVRSLAGEVLVSVTDNGVGLPHHQAGDIFDAFFTTKREGLGLGLAVSRSIVEAHHGRIWAEANPDCGASVHFTLPLHEGGSNHASQPNGLRG